MDEQEIQRGGISYTVETLRDYAKNFPGAKLFYLIGADNAAKLTEWREPAELAKFAEFVAIPRPGGAVANFPPPFHGRTLKGCLLYTSHEAAADEDPEMREPLQPAVGLQKVAVRAGGRAGENFDEPRDA